MTNRTVAVIWVLAVFLLGAFSGGSIVYLMRPAAQSAQAPDTPRKPGTHEERWVRLVRDLQLTPEQEPKIKQILDEARDNTEKAVSELRNQTDSRMKEVLTSDQFAAWQALVKRHRGKGPRP